MGTIGEKQVEAKRCCVCKERKSIDDFWRSADHCDGHRSSCKDCDREKQRLYREQAHKQIVEIKRSIPKSCRLCFGLPHRVQGQVCSSCGMPAEREAACG